MLSFTFTECLFVMIYDAPMPLLRYGLSDGAVASPQAKGPSHSHRCSLRATNSAAINTKTERICRCHISLSARMVVREKAR